MTEQTLTGDIKRHSNWSIFNGVLITLLGVFLIAYPMIAATLTTLLLGCILIVVGIAQFVFALHSHSIGKFLLKILLGVLYLIAGVGLTFFPIAGVVALTVFLGTLLVVSSIVQASIGLQLRPVEGWRWFLFDAAVTLLMGILILGGWPSSSLWAIGTLVGVSVLMNGISRIMIATRMRSTIAGAECPFRKAA